MLTESVRRRKSNRLCPQRQVDRAGQASRFKTGPIASIAPRQNRSSDPASATSSTSGSVRDQQEGGVVGRARKGCGDSGLSKNYHTPMKCSHLIGHSLGTHRPSSCAPLLRISPHDRHHQDSSASQDLLYTRLDPVSLYTKQPSRRLSTLLHNRNALLLAAVQLRVSSACLSDRVKRVQG